MNIAFLIDILPKSGGGNSALAAECNVIKTTYSKKKVEKIIRAAHLENYPVYISFYNYQFFLNLNEKK
jgi:hypothetical protein